MIKAWTVPARECSKQETAPALRVRHSQAEAGQYPQGPVRVCWAVASAVYLSLVSEAIAPGLLHRDCRSGVTGQVA